jgi:transcriptional regulator with XRE-family HTH domain
MTIGERLREERTRLRLSQPIFAEIAGTTKQTIFSWETGKTAPVADQLADLTRAGVDVLYVLTGERSASAAVTPSEVALLDNYRHSTEDVQRGVSKLLAETGRALERAGFDPEK